MTENDRVTYSEIVPIYLKVPTVNLTTGRTVLMIISFFLLIFCRIVNFTICSGLQGKTYFVLADMLDVVFLQEQELHTENN